MLMYLFISTAATCAGMRQQPSIGIGENAVEESCLVSLPSQAVIMTAAVDNAARNLLRDLQQSWPLRILWEAITLDSLSVAVSSSRRLFKVFCLNMQDGRYREERFNDFGGATQVPYDTSPQLSVCYDHGSRRTSCTVGL